ncbi:MAG: ABC transporter substrate-binding protein [Chloroflexi bacterium]|nr:MAG: ABC transporter substrate-binding protein [Chloroflexota bacterium]
MKTFGKLLGLMMLLSMIVGCTPTAPKEAPVASEAPVSNVAPAETTLTEAEQWAKDNGLGPYQPETEDWAAIEAAAKKEGKVVIYANSSKIGKLTDAWNALYPDIVYEGNDTDGIDTKMAAEQEAGNVVGDVWFNSDGHILFGKFVPNQWLWSFVPSDVVIPEVTPDRPFAIARHGTDLFGYNQEAHPEGCPITNIWQLTEPEWKSKLFMEDPISDVSMMAKLATFVQYADKMAAAYKDLYGRDWTTDEYAVEDSFGMVVEDAGYLWLRKMAYNAPSIQPGGDEVDAGYATLGMDLSVEPGIGFTGYSSYQTTLDGELAMAPCFGINPVSGVFKTSYLAIANNAPHPNAAKLFIKFALTQDGFDPWNELGNYPAADGLSPAEGMLPLDELKAQVWEMDPVFDWNNVSKVRDFWAVSLLAVPQEEDD